MVRISEIQELDDDSLEQVNLDDYHSDNFDEYLSDNMDTSPITTTEIKASITQDPPFAPPSVTVTVQLEDEQVEEDLYEHRRIRNQKRALRRQHVAERHQEHLLMLTNDHFQASTRSENHESLHFLHALIFNKVSKPHFTF